MCLQSKQTRSDVPWVSPTSETSFHDGKYDEIYANRHKIALRHKKRIIYMCALFVLLFLGFILYKFRRRNEKKAAETRRQSVVEEFNQVRIRRQSMMSTRTSSYGDDFEKTNFSSRNRFHATAF
ncbi:Oidioi.mRNA.OKI2018_I69.chr2.g4783.t1.cds [Oikopleura dioica]|uniref:Oidioi.mRNA.OKI2018_I69.chr2.g4783.t1.cds n=1 Tax=Oikopleura dioica TaxID=34765 RepID=A0ABN7T005_OIKDI|nr:Oidioi.mRNA.OKI2018_I69.chr2.g4783.t1.cds [Oikopleura dioica]